MKVTLHRIQFEFFDQTNSRYYSVHFMPTEYAGKYEVEIVGREGVIYTATTTLYANKTNALQFLEKATA